ncbi:MAG: hypothetical protein ACI92I_000276 [Acidimicrobiales bacterium]|jgi:hypothetical protein
MIKITEENRIAKYREADEVTRTLYISDVVSATLEKKFPDYDKKETYQIIGDTILGFYKTKDLPILLQTQLDITPQQSLQITSELIEFLSPVVAREQAEVETPQNAAPQQQPFQAAMPAEARAEVFRAMAGDPQPTAIPEPQVAPVAQPQVPQQPTVPTAPLQPVPQQVQPIAQPVPVQPVTPQAQSVPQSIPTQPAAPQQPVAPQTIQQQPVTPPQPQIAMQRQPEQVAQPVASQTPPNLPTQQPQSFIPTHIPTQPEPAQQPAAPEVSAEPIDRIHGYGAYRGQYPDSAGAQAHTEAIIRGASQDDLLKRQPKLADMPTYVEDQQQ